MRLAFPVTNCNKVATRPICRFHFSHRPKVGEETAHDQRTNRDRRARARVTMTVWWNLWGGWFLKRRMLVPAQLNTCAWNDCESDFAEWEAENVDESTILIRNINLFLSFSFFVEDSFPKVPMQALSSIHYLSSNPACRSLQSRSLWLSLIWLSHSISEHAPLRSSMALLEEVCTNLSQVEAVTEKVWKLSQSSGTTKKNLATNSWIWPKSMAGQKTSKTWQKFGWQGKQVLEGRWRREKSRMMIWVETEERDLGNLRRPHPGKFRKK